MKMCNAWYTTLALAAAFVIPSSTAQAQVLQAAETADNGGSPGWAIFFDLQATGNDVLVTEMTTFNSAPAFGLFSVELFTRAGSALGGAGASNAGWTSLGSFAGTQGAVTEGESGAIDIADFLVSSSSITGVALRFTNAGPRYYNGNSVFADANLSLTTGESRTIPFSENGTVFTGREFAGSLTYQMQRPNEVPEPASVLLLLAGGVMLFAAKRRQQYSA